MWKEGSAAGRKGSRKEGRRKLMNGWMKDEWVGK
jgi:hypothetical protein